jgi:hypothetical protein
VEQRARGRRLGPVMGQHAVKHHELCGRRDDIIFLGVIGTLCRGNHQSKDEGRDRCQQSHGNLHRIFRFVAQVMVRQRCAKPHREKPQTKNASEDDPD